MQQHGTPVMSAPVQRWLSVIMILTVTACSTTVNVPIQSFPEPVIEPYSVTAALRFNEELADYTYEERLPSGERYSVQVGQAAKSALTETFADLFTETILVNPGELIPDSADLLIEPAITALEFALPSQTVTKDYAVWIKFGLKVYDKEGVLQSEFPVSAYGKASKQSMLSGQKAALTSAASRALRDAGVLLLTRFAKESLLEERQLAQTTNSENKLPLADDRTPVSPAIDGESIGEAPTTTPESAEQFL